MYFALAHTALKDLIFFYYYEHELQYQNKIKFAIKYGYKITKPFEADNFMHARHKGTELLRL